MGHPVRDFWEVIFEIAYERRGLRYRFQEYSCTTGNQLLVFPNGLAALAPDQLEQLPCAPPFVHTKVDGNKL